MSARKLFSDSEKQCLSELIVKYKLNTTATIAAGNQKIKTGAWARLTIEFNSIETNMRRTEAQLKKCWDNMKTRRKQLLSHEKRERMKTGGGPYAGPSTSHTEDTSSQGAIDIMQDVTDAELLYAVDSDDPRINQVHMDTEEVLVPPIVEMSSETNARRTESDSGREAEEEIINTAAPPPVRTRAQRPRIQTQGRNVRAHVINTEFSLRRENYKRMKQMQEELHTYKLAERETLLLAAEEVLKKAKLERQNAEEQLQYDRAQRLSGMSAERASSPLLNVGRHLREPFSDKKK